MLITHLGLSDIPKLGLAGYKHDERLIKLANYVAPVLKFPAVTYRRGAVKTLGMMLNDKIGDCEIATSGHAIQLWTSNLGAEVTISDADIMQAYSRISGYNPTSGANDNGCYENDVDKYLYNTGLSGHKIFGYADADATRMDLIKWSIYIFGCIRLTGDLPLALQSQGRIWEDPKGNSAGIYKRGSWGGHSFIGVDYDDDYLYAYSWGALHLIEWGWWFAYGSQAVACSSMDWLKNKVSPQNFDATALLANIDIIRKEA